MHSFMSVCTRSRYQKISFKPNWICLGLVGIDAILPKWSYNSTMQSAGFRGRQNDKGPVGV
jgi:hypothetical protein